jgi:hypothetical protein
LTIRAISTLQFDPLRTDSPPMNNRLLWRTLAAAACLLTTSSCLPSRGTPVFVDRDAGKYWSGKGVLVEVSPDETQCRVVVRDSVLITRDRWVRCNDIHPRRE